MSLELVDGSRVAIVGAGPAGSFSAYFLLELAERVGLELTVELFESKDFSVRGACGCNNCGGIVSESLVQLLAAEGILLPDTVVQRAIDSYVLHTDVGSVRIETPLNEMRIGAVHRGGGPMRHGEGRWESFDGHLVDLACRKGARLRRGRVEQLNWEDGRPRVHLRGGEASTYDLLIGATGVNSSSLALFEGLGFDYRPPRTTRTFIREYFLGAEEVTEYFGTSMHVFFFDLARLEFAALIPKGDFVTLVILGHGVDKELLDRFLARPEVQACFPPGQAPDPASCQCAPRINVGAALHPYGDRAVLVGDSGVARLYKDGIGAAYRTAKAAALAAIFRGVGAEHFAAGYAPACARIVADNRLGKLLFGAGGVARRVRLCRRVLVSAARREQSLPGAERDLSAVLWDTFTGSSPYSDIVARALRPRAVARLGAATFRTLLGREGHDPPEERG